MLLNFTFYSGSKDQFCYWILLFYPGSEDPAGAKAPPAREREACPTAEEGGAQPVYQTAGAGLEPPAHPADPGTDTGK